MLVLSVILFLTIIAWVAFEIRQTQTRPLLEADTTADVIPQQPIDASILDRLLEKVP